MAALSWSNSLVPGLAQREAASTKRSLALTAWMNGLAGLRLPDSSSNCWRPVPLRPYCALATDKVVQDVSDEPAARYSVSLPLQANQLLGSRPEQGPSPAEVRLRPHDIFQHLPGVPPSKELLDSALKRASRIGPTMSIKNVARRARNQAAKQMDALTKELTQPLGVLVRRFPSPGKLHPFERSLLQLTLGDGVYEKTLLRVDSLRKRLLETGKGCASACAKAGSKREAEAKCEEGFQLLEQIFCQQAAAVDRLKEVAKTLRALPVVDPRLPTLCLVGAPNVGKSSLVRVLSSGKPEVCNYPFTTRGISMGHFFVDSRRHQVTDTPGLLPRPDEDRNAMEKLTLAALDYLPTAVLYVHDLTGECGTTVANQRLLYEELREKYADRPWIDVVSKADLLSATARGEDGQGAPLLAGGEGGANHGAGARDYALNGPPGALKVSVTTEQGLDELVERVQGLLSVHPLGEGVLHPDVVDADEEEGEDEAEPLYMPPRKGLNEDFYWPPFRPGANANAQS